MRKLKRTFDKENGEFCKCKLLRIYKMHDNKEILTKTFEIDWSLG